MKGIERLIGIAGLETKPITNYSVIKENLDFLYEGGSQQSIHQSSFLSFNQNKRKLLFLIEFNQ